MTVVKFKMIKVIRAPLKFPRVPHCRNCVHYIKWNSSCHIFHPVSGEIIYQDALATRAIDNQCGLIGQYYVSHGSK